MPSSYPKAPQIAGNPKEAEQYIGSLIRENAKLREALVQTRSWIVRSGVHNPSAVIDTWIDPALAD